MNDQSDLRKLELAALAALGRAGAARPARRIAGRSTRSSPRNTVVAGSIPNSSSAAAHAETLSKVACSSRNTGNSEKRRATAADSRAVTTMTGNPMTRAM